MRHCLRFLATLFVAVAPPMCAQPANPDSARIITRDVANFWRAVDRAHGKDSAALVQAIRTVYLANPSPGLFDWVTNRLAEQGRSAATLQAKGIRANTLAVDTSRAITDSIRAAYRRLKSLYPDAKFGDVYFLIGRMTSGGTTGRTELLIGTEMYGRDPSTPVDELPAWHRAVTSDVGTLPHIVAHEMIHTLQAPREGRQTLLSATLNEGSADFLSELISGRRIVNPAYAFGDAHEKELWAMFKAAMDGSNTSAWLYQGDKAPPGRPADLGYWMGYQISKAYCDRAADKRSAVRDIMLFKNSKDFLAASEYDP